VLAASAGRGSGRRQAVLFSTALGQRESARNRLDRLGERLAVGAYLPIRDRRRQIIFAGSQRDRFLSRQQAIAGLIR